MATTDPVSGEHRADCVPVKRTVVPRQVDIKPVFRWRATVEFTTNYDLPNNVIERAVVQAIGADDSARVHSLEQLVETEPKARSEG